MYGSFPCSAVRVCALRCDNDHGLDKSAVKIEVLMSTYKTPRRTVNTMHYAVFSGGLYYFAAQCMQNNILQIKCALACLLTYVMSEAYSGFYEI